MTKFIKKYYIFIFIFFFFLIFNLIISPLNLDEVWSYGFSNNLYKGLVPYKDFNMVITLFQPFLYSLPMYLFGNSLLVYHLFHTFIITMFFIITYKLIDKKVFIILPFFIFPMNISFPNYNFLLLFLFVLVIYLEKNSRSDYLIGFILGLLFLTKQSVGLSLFLVTFYYIKSRKFLKRLVGFIGPILIFLIYLFISNSLFSFIDLCILGLFDFSGNSKFNICFIFTIILLFILILYLKRDYKNIYIYYFIMFISIVIPLFDYYHFMFFFISFLIFFLMNSNIKIKYSYIGIIISIMLFINCLFDNHININNYPNKINHFEYRYLDKNYIKYTNDTLDLMEKYNNKVIFVGIEGYYFKIIKDIPIKYYDLVNTGNYGYNGSLKLLNNIKELDDYVFFIDKDNLGNQTDKKLINYVLDDCLLIEEGKYYSVYQNFK